MFGVVVSNEKVTYVSLAKKVLLFKRVVNKDEVDKPFWWSSPSKNK
jgi:hypothetical protein